MISNYYRRHWRFRNEHHWFLMIVIEKRRITPRHFTIICFQVPSFFTRVYIWLHNLEDTSTVTLRRSRFISANSDVIRSVFVMNVNRVTVYVREGQLIGIVEENVHGGHYVAFRGIPYARPPVGKLRFKVSSMICLVIFVAQHETPVCLSIQNWELER